MRGHAETILSGRMSFDSRLAMRYYLLTWTEATEVVRLYKEYPPCNFRRQEECHSSLDGKDCACLKIPKLSSFSFPNAVGFRRTSKEGASTRRRLIGKVVNRNELTIFLRLS